MIRRVSIVYVDDDALAADRIQEWAAQLEVDWLGAEPSLSAGLALCHKVAPTLVILGTDLPDGDSLEAIPEYRGEGRSEIMLITRRCSEGFLLRLRHLPLKGVMVKSARLGVEFEQAIKAIGMGANWYSPLFHTAVKAISSGPEASRKILSERELVLMRDFGLGLSDQEIAERHRLAPGTVHTHRKHIMGKLRLHTVREVMAWALTKGFVSVQDFYCLRDAYSKTARSPSISRSVTPFSLASIPYIG